jgi:hypothetical protein
MAVQFSGFVPTLQKPDNCYPNCLPFLYPHIASLENELKTLSTLIFPGSENNNSISLETQI